MSPSHRGKGLGRVLSRGEVRELVDLLTTLVNESLMQGRLPASQKHAIISPRLKKSGLDPTDRANFRPVSSISFISKVVERAAASQLNDYFTATTASVGMQEKALNRNSHVACLV